jgi:transcriptional regulator with XRE-family HTH domain
MQDLWGDENSTYKFFTYMCPRLYDLGTVAYWMLEKEAHSQTFKANLRHITQVVIELYKKKEKLFIKALKLDRRSNREAFKPHSFEIDDNSISIIPTKKESSLDIGSRLRDKRIKLGMSQKDLAEKIGLTSSFISQIENNQISPSLHSFLQIANTMGINPTVLLQKDKKSDDVSWFIKGDTVKKNLFEKQQGYSIFTIISGDKTSVYRTVIHPVTDLKGHFLNYKKEELIYVLKGKVYVKVENSEKELKKGDSIYLKDSLPSYWRNKTKEEVELLVTCI